MVQKYYIKLIRYKQLVPFEYIQLDDLFIIEASYKNKKFVCNEQFNAKINTKQVPAHIMKISIQK